MNRDQFENQWPQIKVVVKEKWDNLTDDDIRQINGRYDQLIAKLQQKYGYTRDAAEEDVRSWNFDRSPRFNQERERVVRDDYRKSSDTGSAFKWLLIAGIPLLLLAAYLSNYRNPTNINDTTSINQPASSTAIEASAADRAISDNVRRALATASATPIDFNQVRIVTNDGVVTLSGSVPSNEQRALIQRTAEAVPGVDRVINQLSVNNSMQLQVK